jgi:hypothetical protein
MATLLDCFRGAGGARLLQVWQGCCTHPLCAVLACWFLDVTLLACCCCDCLPWGNNGVRLLCDVEGTFVCSSSTTLGVSFLPGHSSISLPPLRLQRRGGLIIQQLSQRLGGLRVYKELSRLLQVCLPAGQLG